MAACFLPTRWGTKLPSKTPQMGEVIPRWNGDGVFTGRKDKPGESSKRA